MLQTNNNQALAIELMDKIHRQTLKPSSRTYTAICENPSCRNTVKHDGDYCVDCLWHQMASLSVGDLTNKYVLLCEDYSKGVSSRFRAFSEVRQNSDLDEGHELRVKSYQDAAKKIKQVTIEIHALKKQIIEALA